MKITTFLVESYSCHSSGSCYLRCALRDSTLVDRYSERFGGEGIEVKGRALPKCLVFLENCCCPGQMSGKVVRCHNRLISSLINSGELLLN